MLLIDEIDRADEEFEAFLLEVLSDFQITIPEIGTIRGAAPPAVILTSNRTRELHDALKRRCLFHWIGHPSIEREIEIVSSASRASSERLAAEAAAFVRELRGLDLTKPPGVAETIDWAMALTALGRQEIDAEVVEQTLGSILKYREDVETVRDDTLAGLVDARPRAAAAASSAVASDAFVRHVVTFGRVLREAGLEVGPGRVADALRALDAVEIARQEDVYWTLRTTLVARRDELDLFDRAFTAWFLRAPVLPPAASRRPATAAPGGSARTPRREARRAEPARRRRRTRSSSAHSAHEVLRREGLRRDDARRVLLAAAG